MSTENLKIGDGVKISSGGPLMTISESLSNGTFRCLWYSKLTDTYHTQVFPKEALVKIS